MQPIRCNFEDFGDSVGLYINSTFVMCVSPRISGHPDDYYREEVTVRIAINGQDFNNVESEAVVTFVGTGSAKSFIYFIIAAILIALLIIALAFLAIALVYNKNRPFMPNTIYDLRNDNAYQNPRGHTRASGQGRPLS